MEKNTSLNSNEDTICVDVGLPSLIEQNFNVLAIGGGKFVGQCTIFSIRR